MYSIRLATPADADAIGRVNVLAWREAYVELLSPGFLEALSIEEAQRRWRSWLTGGPVWVAEVDGEVRGYSYAGPASSTEKPRDLQLYTLYVLASEYGSGAGQALLDAAVDSHPAFLWVAELNPRAIAFYRRNGFEPDGARTSEERWEDLAEIRMVR